MFKVLKNTSNCTYGDVIKAFQMFWDRPLYYSEDPSEPATMTFDTGEMQGLVDTRPLFITPPIRAAGVTLKLYARTSTELDRDKIRILSGVGYAMTVTELPTLELDYEYSTELLAKSGYIRVTSDTLPPLEREYDISSRLRLGSEVQNMTLSELPTVERMFSYDSSIGAGIAVHSTMETTINGVTADK
jgi:hypothetical protein